MTEAHVRTLANAQQIPLLALGMWQVPDGSTAENAVLSALDLGYRHIDTAQVYGNERSVGLALAQADFHETRAIRNDQVQSLA